ncbi:hypothetical protein VP01_704g3, partial [Puccinia sorghi]
DHSKKFPVLLSLVKDYLAISASSYTAEQILANVCSSGCGSLKPHTIERCVRKFEKAQKHVKNYVDFSQKNSKK